MNRFAAARRKFCQQQHERCYTNTTPTEHITVSVVEGSPRLFFSSSDWNGNNFEPGTVNIARIVEENIIHAAEEIDPATHAVVRAADEWHAVLDCSKSRVGRVLPQI